MSEVTNKLQSARGCAWSKLQPVFDYALFMAEQAEYEAERASNEAQINIPPAYHPLVKRLAASMDYPPEPPIGPPPASGDFECCASGSCEVCRR